eukprot:6691982-Ditylum_brightwellii.AAC.1
MREILMQCIAQESTQEEYLHLLEKQNKCRRKEKRPTFFKCSTFSYRIVGEMGRPVTGVEQKKLTFIGDTDVSLGAFDSFNARATFDDCEWSGQNTGKTSVLIYSGGGSTDLEINLLPV